MRTLHFYRCLVLLITCVLCASPAFAQQPAPSPVYLPLVSSPALPPSPFGVDLRSYASDTALKYAMDARPKWVRAGDIFWSDIEPVRGGGYHWEAIAGIEENIKRIRNANAQVEPTIVVNRTPAWAQSVPGRLCSPPRAEFYTDYARFLGALAQRFASGPTAVRYWEIWNEPDVAPSDTQDQTGMGCWLEKAQPQASGAAYGTLLKQVYPAIKSANPNATVLAGALLYDWPDDTLSRKFLEGMLASGAGNSFDALSFHAYGEWGANDLLVNKTVRLRSVLAAYNLANKPLIATEVAAMCANATLQSCQPNFDEWKRRQANYAARIYAQAKALDLMGSFWFTLSSESPGFNFSQLIDVDNATLKPREAYYAFLNSALLLQDAQYTGQPLKVLTNDQIDKIQVLTFRKKNTTGLFPDAPYVTLYVLWVPRIDVARSFYNLAVPAGATARCIQQLQLEVPNRFMCSDGNNDGLVPLAVNSFPQYVEVYGQ